MHSRMLLQRTVLSKGLVTILAFKRSVIVMGSFVLLQTFLAIKKFVTADDGAFKKHLNYYLFSNKMIIN